MCIGCFCYCQESSVIHITVDSAYNSNGLYEPASYVVQDVQYFTDLSEGMKLEASSFWPKLAPFLNMSE